MTRQELLVQHVLLLFMADEWRALVAYAPNLERHCNLHWRWRWRGVS